MRLGEFEFNEGDLIAIGAYRFEIRRGIPMLQKITVAGGLGYVDFEAGILLILLQNCNWSVLMKGIELEFNKFGWIVIDWMEDGHLHTCRFDDMEMAQTFLDELKEKGLK